jgi:pimeloyl-ACP methyl ester carboxylesterase
MRKTSAPDQGKVIMLFVLIALAALLIAVAVVAGLRQIRRARIARELRVGPRGIAETHFVRIGGVDQWVQIRGEDRSNPVLFVLHGGPGSPYAVFTPLIRSWEKHYTVVQWDRRGCGMTRSRSGPQAGTFAQLVEDAVEVATWVREYLGKDKLILLAGSMGTMIGVPLAQRRPDLFEAFVCTDMYADMHANEAIGYAQTMRRLREAGNTKALARLEAIGADPSTWDLKAWLVKMDLTMKTDPVTPNAVAKLLFPLAFASPLYRLRDAFALLAGFMSVQKQMYAEYSAYDAYKFGTRFEIPFYLLQGESDILTITSLAEEYYERVDAPNKEIALIPGASHFAAFTQPEAFLTALRKATAS